jgi:UDP-GlcNAc:undecaprenyl-phosphate GlcNAc-1-phosphate transferase
MIIFLFSTILTIIIYFSIYNNRTKISLLLNIVDKPDLKRKIHKNPTPKTAAFSIALSLFVFLIINLFGNFIDSDFNLVLIGSILVFFVGYLDDRYRLSPLKKIIFISLISFFVFILSDNLIINKFYIYTFDFFFELKNFSLIFSILCILCLVNSLNLADGINGLATGLIFFWLFFITQIYENNLDLITNIILINLILTFIHNYKGDHFLGDSGSLMLSSFLAFLVINFHNQNIDSPGQLNSSESIFILFIIPVLDMVRLFFERLINKKNPGVGDNNHLHHYLINKFTNRQALIIYFLSVNIPIIMSLYTSVNKIYIIISTILLYIFFMFWYNQHLKKAHVKKKRK